MISTVRDTWVRRTVRTIATYLLALVFYGALIGVVVMYFVPSIVAEWKRAIAERQLRETVEHRLTEADGKSEAAIQARLKPLKDLFAKARCGAKDFSEEALSWSSKWELVKGYVNDDDGHREFLSAAFTRHVLRTDELQAVMESVFRAYMDDIEICDAEMLVALKADLADPARPNVSLPSHLKAGEPLKRELKDLSGTVGKRLKLDLGVTVGRELGIMVASDMAARAAFEAAKAAASELGVSFGIFSAGGASTITTFGLGIVAAFVLDYVVDQVLKIVGYDPEEKIAVHVCESLDRLEDALIRESSRSTSGKAGSLRMQMEQLHQSRSKQRRELIQQLIPEGGRR